MEKPPEQVPPFPYGHEIQVAVSKRRRLLRRCCGCCISLILIIIILALILAFTLFKSKQPVIRIYKYSIVKLELINGTNTPRPGSNATVIYDVSMKNRNFVSVKHPSMTWTVHYRGAVIGEARAPPGTMVARRTSRMNVTLECILDRMLQLPGLDSDMKSGVFNMSAHSRFPGRVKFLFIKKHVKIKMNCAVSVNATSLTFLHLKCKQRFKLS